MTMPDNIHFQLLQADVNRLTKDLRDRFAMAALSGLLARADLNIQTEPAKNVANAAYINADAMLLARQTEETQ